MRRLVLSLTVSALAIAFAAPALARPALEVALDHAQRLQVSQPAGSVIVGNPAVADVTVVDPHTVFVSGRGYGVSEVVVLDPLGRTIWDGEVVVTGSTSGGQVTVYHGATPVEMACGAVCAPSIRSAKSGSSTPGSSPSGTPASGPAPSMPSTSIPAPTPSPGVP
ncbi:MAG TPA: pilus assembly protein N-terminal domain-containing protein [Caulobacteraceae bacterium]